MTDETPEEKETIDTLISKISLDIFVRDAYEKTQQGIILLDNYGKIKYVNPIQANYFGYDTKEKALEVITGKTLFGDFPFCNDSEQKWQLLKSILDDDEKIIKSHHVDVGTNSETEYYNIQLQRLYGGVRVDMYDVTKQMKLATIDQLTNAYNRVFFDRVKFPKILEKAKVMKEKLGSYPIGMIMVDLRDFKVINDKYGHLEGDNMLKNVAELLMDNTKESDLVIRYGGDEFLIICPGADEKILQAIIKRIKIQERIYNTTVKELNLFMKMDIGPAVRTENYKELLGIADKKMYESKRGNK